MRISLAVLVGLLSLLALGCAQEATTTEQPVVAQFEVREVDEADEAEVTEETETPAEAAEAEPTEAPVEPAAESTEPPAEEATEAATTGDGLFPIVVDATASWSDGDRWNVAVTLSSEYDTPARYADAWRVLDASDNELGIRVLGHDHANEQPFTRSTTVDIPADIDVVYVEGRDQVNGWSGERFELTLTR